MRLLTAPELIDQPDAYTLEASRKATALIANQLADLMAENGRIATALINIVMLARVVVKRPDDAAALAALSAAVSAD